MEQIIKYLNSQPKFKNTLNTTQTLTVLNRIFRTVDSEEIEKTYRTWRNNYMFEESSEPYVHEPSKYKIKEGKVRVQFASHKDLMVKIKDRVSRLGYLSLSKYLEDRTFVDAKQVNNHNYGYTYSTSVVLDKSTADLFKKIRKDNGFTSSMELLINAVEKDTRFKFKNYLK